MTVDRLEEKEGKEENEKGRRGRQYGEEKEKRNDVQLLDNCVTVSLQEK